MWQTVKSSNINRVAYFPDALLLLLEFKGGSVYAYPQVPKPVYDGLLSAESKGRYFFKFIKFSFEYMKVTE